MIALLLVAALLLWSAAHVAAQPSTPAPRLPTEAERARQLGLAAASAKDWTNAIYYFTDAHKRAHLAPPLAYNLGRAHALAGHDLAAAAWFRAYVSYLEWKESDDEVREDAKNLAAIRAEMAPVVREIRTLETAAEARIARLFREAVKLAEQLPVEGTTSAPEGVRTRALRWVAWYQYRAGAFDLGNETLAKAHAARRAPHDVFSENKALDLDAPGAPVLLWAMTQAEAGDVLGARANMIRAGGYDGGGTTALVTLVEATLVKRDPTFAFEALARIASQTFVGWLVQSAGRILASISVTGTGPLDGLFGEAPSGKIGLDDAIDRLAELSVQETVKSISGRPLRVLDGAAFTFLEGRLRKRAEHFAGEAKKYDGYYRGPEPVYFPVDFINGKAREALDRLEASRATSMTTPTVHQWLVENVACLLLLSRADDARRAVEILETVKPWETEEFPAMLALARAYLAIAGGRIDDAMKHLDQLPRLDSDAIARPSSEWNDGVFSDVLPLRLVFRGAAGSRDVARTLALHRAAFDFAVGAGHVEAAVRIADRLPLSYERRSWLRDLARRDGTFGGSEYLSTLTERQAAALRAVREAIARFDATIRLGWEPDDPNGVEQFEQAVLAAERTNHRAIVDLPAVVKQASAASPEQIPGAIAQLGYIHARELLRARTTMRVP